MGVFDGVGGLKGLTRCDASHVVRSISWRRCSACSPAAIFRNVVCPEAFRTRKTEVPPDPDRTGSILARESLDRHDLGSRSRGSIRFLGASELVLRKQAAPAAKCRSGSLDRPLSAGAAK